MARNKTGPSYLQNETLRSPEAMALTRAAMTLTWAEATAGQREATVGQCEATAAWRMATATLHPSPSCFSPVIPLLPLLSPSSGHVFLDSWFGSYASCLGSGVFGIFGYLHLPETDLPLFKYPMEILIVVGLTGLLLLLLSCGSCLSVFLDAVD